VKQGGRLVADRHSGCSADCAAGSPHCRYGLARAGSRLVVCRAGGGGSGPRGRDLRTRQGWNRLAYCTGDSQPGANLSHRRRISPGSGDVLTVTADWSRGSASSPEEPYCDIESLITAMYDQLTRTAFRAMGNYPDAEDAVQDACVKALRSWPRVGSLATAGKQCAYLLKIVINETLQIRRRPYRGREFFGIETAEFERDLECSNDHRQAASDHLRLVWKAISDLPEDRREVVALFAAGYEYQQIAAMLQMPVSTVRSHICRARHQLPRPSAGFWEEGQQ
jgi:RNA polymerase sigma-70 factor, ECF subfamily